MTNTQETHSTDAYGNELCNTCCNPAGAPYRRYDERGKVREGCVDEFHTGHLVTPSESARWHGRPEAKRVRLKPHTNPRDRRVREWFQHEWR